MTHSDIFQRFLEGTTDAAKRLSDESDVMDIERLDRGGEGLYRLTFHIAYLTQDGPPAMAPGIASPPLMMGQFPSPGRPTVSPGPLEVAVRMSPEYLRQLDPLNVVQCRDPRFWHPNFSWPVLCVGGITAGTPLDKLCRHIYEIVTYQNYSTDDSLNPVAAIRLRDEPEVLDQLPAPPRLVRRPLSLDFTATA